MTLGTFYEKELLKTNQISLELKKWSREKVTNNMSNVIIMITLLTIGLIKVIPLYKMSYFSTNAISP